MRRGLLSSVIIISIFAVATIVGARVGANIQSVQQKTLQRPTEKLSKHPHQTINAKTYRSPGNWRKVTIAADDSSSLALAAKSGAVLIADYSSFKLFSMPEAEAEAAVAAKATRKTESHPGIQSITVRDDFNLLYLRSGLIDTTDTDAAGTLFNSTGKPQPGLSAQSVGKAADSSGLMLVQFVGPVKNAWLDRLKAEGFDLIAYVPNNGYLIRGDSQAQARLASLALTPAASGGGFVQWQGPFATTYKIHPNLAGSGAPGKDITVAIQFLRGYSLSTLKTQDDIRKVVKMARKVLVKPYDVLNFTNIRVQIDSNLVSRIAALPTVVNIEPWTAPRMLDELSDQIDAAQLASDGSKPNSPGYMSWLVAHGFNSPFNFAIDITDSGIDRGSTDAASLHPDFLSPSGQSRLIYANNYTTDPDSGDTGGHGTLNMSVAAGDSSAVADSSGYALGMGVAPFAMLASSKIFADSGLFDLSVPYTNLIAAGYQSGSRVFSNSWGADTNQYTIDSEEFDLRVRDADPSQPGNQEAVICFAAGNGGFPGSIGDPGSGKNVITVGASESARAEAVDGCGVADPESDDAESMAFFSSQGPVFDGRMKPDLVAPGTHIQGAASQNSAFDGTGVCGPKKGLYFPAGQTLYTWSSGTSHSTPQIAGAAALVRQYLINNGNNAPSAAIIKALLLNTTSYLTGLEAGGNLPQAAQGWGLLNLDRAFDDSSKILVDQTNMFTESGQQFTITGEVKDPSRPFRVTLAWTDAAGFSAFAPWVNDLNLEVTINGQVYRGNNFQGQTSQPGGDPDSVNNVESVWLPAGTVGTFQIKVIAANITGDGVPGNSTPLDQDFALVAYNADEKPVPVLTFNNIALSSSAGSLAEPGGTTSLTVDVNNISATAFSSAQATITSQTAGVNITTPSTGFPAIAGGASGGNSSPFVFTLDSSVKCGSTVQFGISFAGQSSTISFSFSIPVGDIQPVQTFNDTVEPGDSNWTHASYTKKVKKAFDTWSISTNRSHSGGSSWFSQDPNRMADAHLDSIPIQLPSNQQSLQLVFYHAFAFDNDFDGGVLEISTGDGNFQDLGQDIISGGYNGILAEYNGDQNPLAGQQAWVGGNLAGFQKVTVDLSSFAGKTVIIRFRFVSDQTVGAGGWYIDDISVNGNTVTCTPTP